MEWNGMDCRYWGAVDMIDDVFYKYSYKDKWLNVIFYDKNKNI